MEIVQLPTPRNEVKAVRSLRAVTSLLARSRSVETRRVSWIVVSRVAVGGAGLATVLLTSRLLSTNARGLFATVQAAVLVASVVGCASLWLGVSVVLPKHPHARGMALVASLAWSALLLGAGSLGIASGAAEGVAAAPVLAAFVIVSVTVMLYTNVQGMPIGLNQITTYAKAEILRAAVGVTALVTLLAIGQRHPSHLLLIWGISSWGAATAYLVLRSRPYGRTHDWTLLRGVVSRSLRAHPNNIIALGVLRLDILVLAALSSRTQVAFYSFAVALSEGVWLIPGAIAVVGLADYSRLDAPAAASAARRNLRRAFLAAFATAIVLLAAGVLLILFFLQPAYHAAIVPLAVSIAGALLYSANHAVNPWIVVALDRPGFSSLIAIGTLALNMILLVMLASHGATGAAIASASSYALASCVYIVVLRRRRTTAVSP